MKVTAIIKDVNDQFFSGNGGSIVGLNNLDDKEKFDYLMNKGVSPGSGITTKVGNGSFRDKVELNQIRRNCPRFTYKLEFRKGYQLATFEVTA